MADFDSVWQAVAHRRDSDSPAKRRMIEIREYYHGDWAVPLYDVDGESTRRATIPAIVTNVIDLPAQLAASTEPSIHVPALRDNQESRKRAELATVALRDAWRTSQWKIHRRRVFRHLAAYGTASVVVVPDHEKHRGRMEVRDPLCAYPDPRSVEMIDPPKDCAWVFGMTKKQILARWPEMGVHFAKFDRTWNTDPIWDVFEWIDEDDVIMGLLGPRLEGWQEASWFDDRRAEWKMELRRAPNRAWGGIVPCYSPARVTLQRIAGQLDHLTGHVEVMARMNALMEVAIEKGIFPDTYLLASTDRPPMLVGGRWHDGRSGQINVVQNAEAIGQLQNNVGFQTPAFVDQLERNIMVSSGLDQRMIGETGGAALRTGQAISAMTSISVDSRLQELHEIDEAMLTHLHSAVLAVDKGYFPAKTVTVFSGTGDSTRVREYVPARDVEHLHNAVEYPMPGADINSLGVALMQRKGAGAISGKTMRRLDPLVKDPDGEENEVIAERLDEALLQGVLAQAQQGTLPAIDVARIRALVRKDVELSDAIIQADEEARARQAELVAAQAPAAQPGLAVPGMGAESQVLPPPEPGRPPDRLRELLTAMRAAPPAEGGGGTPVFSPSAGQLPSGVAV